MRIVFTVLRLVWFAIVTFHAFIQGLYFRFVWAFRRRFRNVTATQAQRDVSLVLWKKQLHHVAIVVTEKHHSFERLCNLMCWLTCAGVTHLSVLDKFTPGMSSCVSASPLTQLRVSQNPISALRCASSCRPWQHSLLWTLPSTNRTPQPRVSQQQKP